MCSLQGCAPEQKPSDQSALVAGSCWVPSWSFCPFFRELLVPPKSQQHGHTLLQHRLAWVPNLGPESTFSTTQI